MNPNQMNYNQLFKDYANANLEGLKAMLAAQGLAVVPAQPVEMEQAQTPTTNINRPEPVIVPNHDEFIAPDEMYQLWMTFDKPCRSGFNCSFAANCKVMKSHKFVKECGKAVLDTKKAAMEGGILLIKVSAVDGVMDEVFKDGVKIGVVQKNDDNKPLLKLLEKPKYLGKTLKFVSTLDPRTIRESVYTRLHVEFIGVEDGAPTPPPAQEVQDYSGYVPMEEPPMEKESTLNLEDEQFILPW